MLPNRTDWALSRAMYVDCSCAGVCENERVYQILSEIQ